MCTVTDTTVTVHDMLYRWNSYVMNCSEIKVLWYELFRNENPMIWTVQKWKSYDMNYSEMKILWFELFRNENPMIWTVQKRKSYDLN